MAKNAKKRHRNIENIDPAAFRRSLFSKRGTIREALPSVRQRTPASVIAECIKPCLEIPAFRAAFVPAPFPTAYSSIKPLRPFAPVSPEFDFEWTSIILEHFSAQLTIYVEMRDKFYDRILLDDHVVATEILDAIEAQFGVSLWLIGARIAVLQASAGVTAQKEFLESLLDQSGLNLLVATVAFYLSFAAEEHVSKAELDRELDEMWDGSAHLDIIEYFRYHSNPLDLPEKPHVVVALEENSPIIDRFETFIDMAQLTVARSKNLSDASFLIRSMKRINIIPDIRIQNLSFLFEPYSEYLVQDQDFTLACDKYTMGEYDFVYELANSELAAAPRKAWWYDLANRCTIKRRLDNSVDNENSRHFMGRILASLERQRTMSGDVDETGFRIQKLMLLGRRMPSSRYLASVDRAAMPMLLRDEVSLSQLLWILSSPLDNPLHLRQIYALSPGAAAVIRNGVQHSSTMAISAAVLAGEGPSVNLLIPTDRRMQFEGHAAINRNDPSAALHHYHSYRKHAVGADRLRSLTLIYTAQRRSGSYKEAVSLFAEAYLRDQTVLRLVPLPDLAKWIAENQAIDALALDASILLHAYATLHDTEHDGDLSDGYENTLDYFDVDRPSSLLKIDHGIRPDALIYYIRNICTIARMEDGTGFDDIDDIENERVQLLQWLIGVHPEGSAQYISEIKVITKDQAVASMSAHLERSKIYVNEDIVRRSFDTEMRYSFARFRELLIEPELEIRAESIEQRIRKLLKDAESELRDLKLPSTEREGLFRSMFIIALQEFLVYPNGGLKTYLSTRILHGALEGEMRSNLARAQLLLPREKANALSDFDRAWSSQLASLDPALFAKAREAVIRFSTRFSEYLLELINDKIRIRLTTTPNGLLMYDSRDERMQMLRRQISEIERYDDFIDALFHDFWSQTEEGLTRVKNEIEGVFSGKVYTLFDALASSVAQLGDEASELLNAIVQARTDFALSVQRVSAWFARSGALPEHPFKLDVAIETAMRITNNCFPGREVSASFEGEAVVDLPGEWLNPVVDLFCNCFQNVVEHGGQAGPQQIQMVISEDSKVLSIAMTNRLSDDIDLVERTNRIAKSLDEAHDGDHHRATEEFGSGFSKIVRIIKYDIPAGGSFDIEVTKDRDVVARIIVPSGGSLCKYSS